MSAIVILGKAKDPEGFPCEVLEDELTKQRYLAYSPEVWAEKVRQHNELIRINQRERNGRENPRAHQHASGGNLPPGQS